MALYLAVVRLPEANKKTSCFHRRFYFSIYRDYDSIIFYFDSSAILV